MTNGACYLLFEGSKDHALFAKLDGEPELMIKGKLYIALCFALLLLASLICFLASWMLSHLLIFQTSILLLIAGTEGFSALSAKPSETVLESGVPWQKEEVIKEPYVGSLRNLLLYPGT